MNSFAVCQGIFLGLKGRDGKRCLAIRARERQKQGLSMDCAWHRSWVLVWLGARSVVCLDFCFPYPWKGIIDISLARLFSVFLDKNFAGISYMAQKPLELWGLALMPLQRNGESWRKIWFFIMLWTPQVPYTVLAKVEWQWTDIFYLLDFCILNLCPFQQSSSKEFDSGRIWMDSILFVVVTPGLIFPVVFLCIDTACVWLHSWWGRVGELDFTIHHPI